MNVEIWAEAAQFPEKEYINGSAVAVRIMTYRGLDNSGLQQAGIACPRKMTLGSWFHQIHF